MVNKAASFFMNNYLLCRFHGLQTEIYNGRCRNLSSWHTKNGPENPSGAPLCPDMASLCENVLYH